MCCVVISIEIIKNKLIPIFFAICLIKDMHVKNTLTEYGLISKLLHWVSAILLFIQIPLGFYLVDLDFGPERLTVEDIHVSVGLSIFYLVILRLLINF